MIYRRNSDTVQPDQQPRPFLDGLTDAQPWRRDALCGQTDPEAFFPEKGGSTREAKAVCNGQTARGLGPCPVRAQCLQHAVDNDERFGIWGGLSERERRKLKRDRRPA